MPVLGAHPEELRRLATAFAGASAAMEVVARATGRRLAAAHWHGPDATALRRDWDRRGRAAVLAAASSAAGAARALRAQADQQERASAGAGPAAGVDALGPPPTRTDRAQLSAGAGFDLLGVSAAGTVEVEDRGGRRVVTVARQVAGGVGLSSGVGAWARVDGAGGGSAVRAELAAEAVSLERRTYVVRPDQVGLLVAQAAADSAAQAVPVLGTLARARALVDDSLVDHPIRTDQLVALRVGGGAGVALGTGGAAADVGQVVAVGVGHGRAGEVLLVEYGGSASAAVRTAAERVLGRSLPVDAGGSVQVHLAAAVDGPGAGRVDLEVETSDGRRATRLDARLEGVRPRAIAALVAAAARGDQAGAARALGSLAPEGVTLRPLVGRTTTRSASAGAGATVLLGGQGSLASTRWTAP